MKKSSKRDKVFAKGFNFKKIFIFFVIGCLFGTYYEELLWLFTHHELTNRQGLFYGPFSPIYGLGVIVFVIFLGKNNDNRSNLKTFIYSMFIGGGTEYLTSVIAEYVFSAKYWDYSNKFLNINGRTTIPFMIFWGLLGLVLMKVIYPKISNLIECIPYKIGTICYYILFVFIIFDLFVTYSALFRMSERDKGHEAITFIGNIYDKKYTDEYIYDKFPIMSKSD